MKAGLKVGMLSTRLVLHVCAVNSDSLKSCEVKDNPKTGHQIGLLWTSVISKHTGYLILEFPLVWLAISKIWP